MKKIAIILAVLLALSICLIACNKNQEEDDETPTKKPAEVTTLGDEDNTTDGNGDTTTDGNEETTTDGTQGGNIDVEKTYTFTDLEAPVNVYALKPLNLREQPSFAEDVAKKSVNTGTELIKIAESNETDVDSNDVEYKWFKVKYEDKEYYVKSTLVTSLADPDEDFVEVEKTLYAKGTLKVRLVPSMENEEVGYINLGDEVKIIAENTASGWFKIEFESKYTPKGEYYVVSDAKWWSETPVETDAQ